MPFKGTNNKPHQRKALMVLTTFIAKKKEKKSSKHTPCIILNYNYEQYFKAEKFFPYKFIMVLWRSGPAYLKELDQVEQDLSVEVR